MYFSQAKGSATITTKVGKKSYTCKVTVETPALSKTSATVYKGSSITLKLNGTSQTVKWSTSDKKIATVSNKGVVKGIKVGSCKITATVLSKKYTCTVTVKNKTIAVQTLQLSSSYLEIKKDSSQTLKATISPSNATNKKITYSSSNSKIATLNSSGEITGVSLGDAVITAKTSNGIKKTCSVRIVTDFSATDALKKLSYKVYNYNYEAFATVKNNYKYPISFDVDCIYYKDGKMIGKNSNFNYCLESGNECALNFGNITDSDYNTVEYDNCKLSFNISEVSEYIVSNSSKIKVNANLGSGSVVAEVTNNGVKNDYTNIAIIFLQRWGSNRL